MSIRFLLKNYRIEKGYTQEAMADTLKISRQQYSNIENGKTIKISSENKKQLSAVLNIPEELMENLDVMVLSKNTETNFPINNTEIVSPTINPTDKLLETVLEQNRVLMQLLEKLSAKL